MKTLLPYLVILTGFLSEGFAFSEVDGAYKVTERWSVTLYYDDFNDGEDNGIKEFEGSQTGVITVVDGEYTIINRTGFQWVFAIGGPSDLTNRTISFSGGQYTIEGGYPFAPAYARDAYGLVFLGCFAVRVPFIDGEVPMFHRTDDYTASGPEASIRGGGNMIASHFEAYVSSTIEIEPLPFLTVAGAYSGLFFEDEGVQLGSSGAFTLNVTDSGAFSGKLALSGATLPFTGRFDESGKATNSINRNGGDPVQVEWAMNMRGDQMVAGFVTSASWQSRLEGEGVPKISKPPPSRLVGKYTFVIPGVPGIPTEPFGNGFGTVSVTPKGTAAFKGTLADGTKFTSSAQVSQSGMCPMHVPLYKRNGSLMSWVAFDTNRLNDDLEGFLSWIRPPGNATKTYTNGFFIESELTGSFYRQPNAVNSRIVEITDGVATLEGGGFAARATNAFILSPNNKLTNGGPHGLAVSFAPSSGLFKGTWTRVENDERITIAGAVLQKTFNASGFFTRSNLSGRVLMIPVP